MNWGKRKYGGEVRDLTHLDPFTFNIPAHGNEAPVSARVVFGSHVFTIAWDENYVEDYRVLDGGQSRCFCPTRYEHSLHLPDIIRRASAGRVLFDPQRSLVLIGNPPGVLKPYAVFFRLLRAKTAQHNLDLIVVSAHENPMLRGRVGMDFPHLASIVRGGGAIPWPKK